MAHHYDLRAFQESLARRLREAHAAPLPDSRLAVQAGPRQWLLRLDQVGEVLPLALAAGGRFTPVPLTRPWYAGLANVRGKLVSVIDLAQFTDGVASQPGAAARLVLLAERHQFHCALLVDRMVGLRNRARYQANGVDVADVAADGSPVAAALVAPWAGPGLIDRDGQAWQELDIPALIEDESFRNAGMAAAAAAAAVAAADQGGRA